MAIMVVLILLVPAMIGVLLYERFKGYDLNRVKRIELFLIFAFLINMSVYGVFWLRGWDSLSWNLGGDTTVYIVSFVVQYMVLSLVASVVLAYVLSLVRVGVSRTGTPAQDETQAMPPVQEEVPEE